MWLYFYAVDTMWRERFSRPNDISRMTVWRKEMVEDVNDKTVVSCVMPHLFLPPHKVHDVCYAINSVATPENPEWDKVIIKCDTLKIHSKKKNRHTNSFLEQTHLYTLTCSAVRLYPDNSRHADRRVSKARAIAAHPSTRSLDSRNNRPRGSGRIPLV